MTAAPAAISWSAGKDSCLALLRARDAGVDVRYFMTMMDPDGTSKSHALPPQVIAAQVAALGGRWHPVRTTAAQYAKCFDEALGRLHKAGCRAIVFGDIDLQAHRDWLEPRCRAAGLKAVFPLWRLPRKTVAEEVIARGIRARLIVVDTKRLDASFCGADYDAALIKRLPAGVCPCGEAGEFHTLVWNSPGFRAPLLLQTAPAVLERSKPPLTDTVLARLPLTLAADETAVPVSGSQVFTADKVELVPASAVQ